MKKIKINRDSSKIIEKNESTYKGVELGA